jgi:hypothetical protein
MALHGKIYCVWASPELFNKVNDNSSNKKYPQPEIGRLDKWDSQIYCA